MTVQELIDQLKTFPPEKKLRFYDEKYLYFLKFNEIRFDEKEIDLNGEVYGDQVIIDLQLEE